MRRIRYAVAMSLDGYIAGPKGEADWIIMDPAIDFEGLFQQFDTFLLGRRTFEAMGRAGQSETPGVKTLVFSRTLRPADYPGVTIVAEGVAETVAALRQGSGKDIWLFGGGILFGSLLEARLVDTVEVAIMPVMLGGGIPLLPPPATETKLKLINHKVYEKTGIVSLEYAVQYTRPNKRAHKLASCSPLLCSNTRAAQHGLQATPLRSRCSLRGAPEAHRWASPFRLWMNDIYKPGNRLSHSLFQTI